MKADPYSVLGVDKTANEEVVTKAHRRRAKETHPDKGGHAEEFRAVNEAYLILRDPERRARFDATGETQAPRDTLVDGMIRMVMQAAMELSEGRDVLEAVRLSVREQMKQHAQAQVEHEEKAEKLLRIAERITTKNEGENLLSTALRNQAASLKKQAASLENSLIQGERMLELLREYDFEMPTNESSAMTFSWGKGSSGWGNFT